MNNEIYTLTQGDYAGKYVALISFSDRQVIASGDTPDEVYERAENQGYKKPLVFFVPPKNSINIY